MFHGKMKAVTFSYDDGVTQDQRLIEILNKYGLKCTFNLNSGLLGTANALIRDGVTVAHCKPQPGEIRRIYEGHEIASHTLTHPMLPAQEDREVIRQVEEDRLRLSELAGYEVVGFAYPGGGVNYDHRVAGLIRQSTGIRYCRTIVSSHSFDLQDNLFAFKPTVHHLMEFDEMRALAERFVALRPETPALFYIWGHAYEFDIDNSWKKFEDFCRFLSGRDDIFYGTNKEVLLAQQETPEETA
ncbi:MAG: polysaccharide deacetylase family protein [Clostridia bacterium]|nr:polysaccharide deacetylase family protein [Clostridia bacterium]